MSEAAPTRGIVIAHGLLAEGLVDAVRRITGVGAGVLVGLSNHGLSPEAMLVELRRLKGDGPAVLFADLPSGSCNHVARRLLREDPCTLLIGGVNLAVLLDFVLHRDLPLPELAGRLVEKGRAAISYTIPDSPSYASHPLSSR